VDTGTVHQEVRAGDGLAHVGYAALRSREERAIRLFQEHGGQIQQIGPDIYLTPSQDGSLEYLVRYGGEIEECECNDYVCRGRTCVHLYAVALRVAKKRGQRRDNFVHSFVAGE
jgi:hypothetical protein